VAAVVAVAITAWLVVPLAISTAAPRSTSSLTATHTGRFTDIPVKGITSGGDRLVGSLDISRFGVFKGNMKALGRLDGKVKNSAGKVIGGVLNKKVRLPVLSIDGTSPGTLAKNKICRILHLKLGPIHLNLLGLHIDTNTIIINITAHRGPGNLLGNLLCAIAHLLDNPPAPKGPTANILTAVAKFTSGMRQLS
jgi:hypothetical protein